jgi:hypothetical protein
MKLIKLKKTLKTCLKYYQKENNQAKIKELEEKIAQLDKK